MKNPPLITIQLIHIYGPLKGEIQEFSAYPITIGRHQSCTLRFPADLVCISRKHAEIRREGNQFKISDFSANGTFLNGKKVKEAFLNNGDVLEITEGGPKFSFLTTIAEAARQVRGNSPLREATEHIPEEKHRTEEDYPRMPQLAGTESADIFPPAENTDVELPSRKVKAQLIIQYGPSIRSFKELPISIGKNPNCDFVLSHNAIIDRHAEVFFYQDQYWIKDLTGQNIIQKNDVFIEFQTPLDPDDKFSLGPQGPVFRFLGEGRFAEMAETPPETPSTAREKNEISAKNAVRSTGKNRGTFLSKLKKKF